MVTFFETRDRLLYAVKTAATLDPQTSHKLSWLFGDALLLDEQVIPHRYIGPRKEMITPWSTNAVEITQNMGIGHIERIELFIKSDYLNGQFDAMLQANVNAWKTKIEKISKVISINSLVILFLALIFELILRYFHIPYSQTWIPSENAICRFDNDLGWHYLPNTSTTLRPHS